MLTTETTIGHMIFNKRRDADAFVKEMSEMADAGEAFEVCDFQGGRFHVARIYNGTFEAYC